MFLVSILPSWQLDTLISLFDDKEYKQAAVHQLLEFPPKSTGKELCSNSFAQTPEPVNITKTSTRRLNGPQTDQQIGSESAIAELLISSRGLGEDSKGLRHFASLHQPRAGISTTVRRQHSIFEEYVDSNGQS